PSPAIFAAVAAWQFPGTQTLALTPRILAMRATARPQFPSEHVTSRNPFSRVAAPTSWVDVEAGRLRIWAKARWIAQDAPRILKEGSEKRLDSSLMKMGPVRRSLDSLEKDVRGVGP